MGTMLIKCARCGKVNRVPELPVDAGLWRCGGCKEPLRESLSWRLKRKIVSEEGQTMKPLPKDQFERVLLKNGVGFTGLATVLAGVWMIVGVLKDADGFFRYSKFAAALTVYVASVVIAWIGIMTVIWWRRI